MFRKWNATIQTTTNAPGTIFNEAYDYTSDPEGDSQLCDKITEEFESGTCSIEPGKIVIYGESSGNTGNTGSTYTSTGTIDSTIDSTSDSGSNGGSPGSSPSSSNHFYGDLNRFVFVALAFVSFFIQ